MKEYKIAHPGVEIDMQDLFCNFLCNESVQAHATPEIREDFRKIAALDGKLSTLYYYQDHVIGAIVAYLFGEIHAPESEINVATLQGVGAVSDDVLRRLVEGFIEWCSVAWETVDEGTYEDSCNQVDELRAEPGNKQQRELLKSLGFNRTKEKGYVITFPQSHSATINHKEEVGCLFPGTELHEDYRVRIESKDCNPPRFHIERQGWDVTFLIETGELYEVVRYGVTEYTLNYMLTHVRDWLDAPCSADPSITNRTNAETVWLETRVPEQPPVQEMINDAEWEERK